MSRGLALLALGLAWGCSGSGTEQITDPVDKDDGGGDGGGSGTATQGDNDSGMDSGPGNTGSDASAGTNDPDPKDAGPDSSADVPCKPLYGGCDDKYPDVDPATLCGQIDNGCGVMIECDPEGDNCSGSGAACNDPTKPNQCGCLAKTCQNVIAGGAKCGVGIADGCGGTIADCGTCPGAQDVCTDQLTCECAPSLSACEGKVCGMKSDGCGNEIACGGNNGRCDVGDCSSDQTKCTCPDKATACAGSTTQIRLPNGCEYDCSPSCVPNNSAACAGATCGSAQNNCGETVNCGSSGGGCESGETCVETTYVTGDTVPAREGAYQGGICVDDDVANLLGKYGVRTHAFRQGGSNAASSKSRAQALSLVTITTNAAGTVVHLHDEGCSATSRNFPGTLTATSNAAPYANIAPVDIDLTVSGNAQGTGTWERPVVGNGIGAPTGFTPGMPPYCVGREGTDVDLPLGDARGWFKDGPDEGTAPDCLCPIADLANSLPTKSAGAPNEDCRINDADADGLPGFTVSVDAFFRSTAYNVSYSQIIWKGNVVPSGYHTAVAIERDPIQRATVGCSGNALLCSNAAGLASGYYDCPCGTSGEFNLIQFAPIDGFADPNNDGWTCREVAEQQAFLFVGFGSCAQAADCPEHTLCTGGKCWPATTNSACAGNTEACPEGMYCATPGVGGDNACWPNGSECPAPNDSATDSCKVAGTCAVETVGQDCFPGEQCLPRGNPPSLRCTVPGNCTNATVEQDCATGQICDASVSPNRCKNP